MTVCSGETIVTPDTIKRVSGLLDGPGGIGELHARVDTEGFRPLERVQGSTVSPRFEELLGAVGQVIFGLGVVRDG